MDRWGSRYDRLISDLSRETRLLLAAGAEYWSDEGPARLREELAVLMNYRDADQSDGQLMDLALRLRTEQPISVLDLTRALLVTELGISSSVLGPRDWYNLWGPADQDYGEFLISEFAALLRAQDELLGVGVPVGSAPSFPSPGRSA